MIQATRGYAGPRQAAPLSSSQRGREGQQGEGGNAERADRLELVPEVRAAAAEEREHGCQELVAEGCLPAFATLEVLPQEPPTAEPRAVVAAGGRGREALARAQAHEVHGEEGHVLLAQQSLQLSHDPFPKPLLQNCVVRHRCPWAGAVREPSSPHVLRIHAPPEEQSALHRRWGLRGCMLQGAGVGSCLPSSGSCVAPCAEPVAAPLHAPVIWPGLTDAALGARRTRPLPINAVMIWGAAGPRARWVGTSASP
mmetsp:Transcript_18544/g.44318  ORF Transcript_18544/g.44318 Transcript_18544/m.44318 type:complete len:254 (+) Transcript_18544:474-1235(+)